MFIKKRPTDLPKSPDLTKVSDYSLFASSKRETAERDAPDRASDMGGRGNRRPVEDFIDVEVIEVRGSDAKDLARNGNSGKASDPEEPEKATVSASRTNARVSAKEEESTTTVGTPLDSKTSTSDSPSLKIFKKKTLSSLSEDDSAATATLSERPRNTSIEKNDPTTSSVDNAGVRPAARSMFSALNGFKDKALTAAASLKASPPHIDEKSALVEENSLDTSSPAAPDFSSQNTLGRFGKKANPSVTSASPSSASEKPSLLSRLFGDKADKLSRATGEKKKAMQSAGYKPSQEQTLDVLVELEGMRRVYWRISSNQVEEIPAESVNSAISFSKNEQRFNVELPVSFSAAQDLALAEMGEDVRVINASRSVRAVYASTAARIQELQPIQTSPGLLLIEHLLKDLRTAGESLICGLVLKGNGASQSLALIYHFTENDEVGDVQVTVNPDNLNFILAQFAASRKLDVAETKVVLLQNDDLLKVAHLRENYPHEQVWQGIAVRKIVWNATALAAVVAVGTALYAAQGYWALHAVNSKVQEAQDKKALTMKNVDQVLTHSVVSFAQSQSLNLSEVTERAGEVWAPGAKVTVEASTRNQTYRVELPLTRGGLVGNRPSVLHQLALSNVEPLLNMAPPKGCTKAVPEVSGGMNAIQITVACESLAGALSAYRID